jgi:hypothetical protein
MKKIWILACACALLSVAGFAQTPSHPPLAKEALAAILASPAAPGSCATQPAQALFMASGTQATPAAAPLADTIEHACMQCDLTGLCEECCRCTTGLPLTACVSRCEGGR